METKLVAEGYGVVESNIRKHKMTKKDELLLGKHYITVTNSNGGEDLIFWTKRGVIRLGFFIKSARAKLFRDWSEDLIVKELEFYSNNFITV
jgi:hypothetical protein